MSLRKFDKGITCCCVIIDGEEKEEEPLIPLGSINDPLCYLGFAETDCQRLMAGQQRGSGTATLRSLSQPASKGVHTLTSSPAKDWLHWPGQPQCLQWHHQQLSGIHFSEPRAPRTGAYRHPVP